MNDDEFARGVLLALVSIRDTGDPGHADRTVQIQRVMRAAILIIIRRHQLATSAGEVWTITDKGRRAIE